MRKGQRSASACWPWSGSVVENVLEVALFEVMPVINALAKHVLQAVPKSWWFTCAKVDVFAPRSRLAWSAWLSLRTVRLQRQIPFVVAVVVWLGGNWCAAVGAGYEVEGETRYFPLVQVDRGAAPIAYRFRLQVDGDRWLLEMERASRLAEPGGFSRCIVAGDGTAIYVTRVTEPQDMVAGPGEQTNSAAFRAAQEQLRRGLLPQWAEVFPGPVPPWLPWDANLLWLVYVGGHHLRMAEPPALRMRFFTVNPYEPNEPVDVRCGYHPKETNLLLWLARVNPGHASRGPGKPRFVFAPPFDKGFTNMLYELLETREVKGSIVPTKFRFTWFQAQIDPATGGILASERMAGEVHRATALRGRLAGRPPLGQLYQVTDHRAASMNDGKPLVYRTHREWWQTNEARFVKALQGIFEEEKPAQLSRWTVWAAFGLLVVLYWVGYWVWRLRRQSQAGSVPGGG
ncbi:hypothetical protein ACPDIX_09175 [Limisphaera sp. 4302-co]